MTLTEIQSKLAQGVKLIYPYAPITDDQAQAIAKTAIERAGDGAGVEYAYRLASLASGLKHSMVGKSC